MSDHPVATSEDLQAALKRIDRKYFGVYPLSDEQHAAVDTLVSLAERAIAIEQDAELKESVAFMQSCFGAYEHEKRVLNALLSLIPTLSQRPEIPI